MFHHFKISSGRTSAAPHRRRLILAAVAILAAAVCLPPAQRTPAADEPAPDGAKKSLRDELRTSDSWRKTISGLDQWLSVQPIYDRDQLDEIKQQLTKRLEKMPAIDLEEFRQDLDAKMQMLLSPEGRSILEWVRANLEAAAPAYRKKMNLQYPDVMKLTAAQLRLQLDALEQRRSTARNQTAVLGQSRQARIAALQADQKRQDAARERALDRASTSADGAGYRTHYFPGSSVRQYRSQIGPPVYGYGFGFW